MVEPTVPIPAPPADGVAENHGVRFEHSDINPKPVVIFGVSLIVGMGIASLVLWGLFAFFASRAASRDKEASLPPAAVDANRLPPQPRLEEMEDLRKGKLSYRPARAEEHLRAQKARLEDGDPALGAIKIDDAIKALAGKLPVRDSEKGGH